MKTKEYKMKLSLYSALVAFTAAVTISSPNAFAEDDMMGTMPAQQQPAQPMQPDPADADHDHDQMEADHKQMKKDHKKMKKDAAAKGDKMQMKKKMGNPDPAKPADGMGHM